MVPDLSDYGKNDFVLIIQMACGERNNAVSVANIYGLAKCFGPKNCHQSINASTLNLLMCDPNGEKQCGFELLKELDHVLSRTDTPEACNSNEISSAFGCLREDEL